MPRNRHVSDADRCPCKIAISRQGLVWSAQQRQAKVVHAALAKGAPKAAPKKGRTLDFAALAEDLLVHVTALEAALKNVKREEREAEQALTKRDAAVAAFEPVYTGIADITAGLLELAGQGDLASRVKPTVRRRAGLDLPAAEPAAAEVPPTTAT